MIVSVIIPTYNEEKVIQDCLKSLSKQTYEDLEFIVVDDGSTDNTLEKVYSLQSTVYSLKVLRQKHKGPGAARNLGVKHAKGEILVFVDSDMTFEKDFIEKLVEPIGASLAKGTWSRDEYVANPDNVWSKCWGINENWIEGRRHKFAHPDNQPVFRAILKSEFDKVGGFDPTGYTDDWTLSKKLGYEAANVPGALFYHKNPDTLREVFIQARWIGNREYKFGVIGKVVALLRAILPISLLIGFIKVIKNIQPRFLVFKVVYDFGIFCGVLSSLLGGSNAK